jgi:hypothetical protein
VSLRVDLAIELSPFLKKSLLMQYNDAKGFAGICYRHVMILPQGRRRCLVA